MTYYKATRPDGTDFRTGTIDYAAALASGGLVRHPAPEPGCEDASGYLSVSTVATDCTGMSLPCRLFRVDPDGETWRPNRFDLPNKVACTSLRVVEELPATLALGPQGEQWMKRPENDRHNRNENSFGAFLKGIVDKAVREDLNGELAKAREAVTARVKAESARLVAEAAAKAARL